MPYFKLTPANGLHFQMVDVFGIKGYVGLTVICSLTIFTFFSPFPARALHAVTSKIYIPFSSRLLQTYLLLPTQSTIWISGN